MKTIKPLTMGTIIKSFAIGGEVRLSIAACACFTLDETLPNRLLNEQDMWPVIEAALEPDEIFDFGLPKVRGEYLVYGSAFSPRAIQGLEVSVRVGTLAKTLDVFGPRHWGILSAGDPSPFTRLPINYNNAFGGPDIPENPAGKGTAPDATGETPLPNVQDPRHLICSPGDRPPPAGFTAYHMDRPQRRRYLGKVDERWLLEDWPHFPRDTNWEFFNTAPEDQRLPGFFTGDEKIETTHMHPARAVLTSSLPALRPRIFVHQKDGDQEFFREVPCRAETLWLFPDREAGVLLYRGTVAVADEEYEDVLHLYGHWESLTEPPKPIEEYGRMFQEELTPSEPPEATATPEPVPAPVPSSPPPEPPAIHPELAALAREAEQLEAQATAILKKAGLDPETAAKRFLPAEERVAAASLEELGVAVAAFEQQTAAFLKKLNISAVDLEKIAAPKPPPPLKSADEIIAELRKAGLHKPEIEAQLKEAEKLNREATAALEDLEKKRAAREAAAAAAPEPQAVPPPPAGQALTVEEVMARYGRRESLVGLDLAGLDFTDRKLAGADFTGAVLNGAIFTRGVLTGAIFSDAILKDADFGGADLTGANLERAAATGGRFQEARLNGAKLGGADFSGADFSDADLSGADAAGTVFEAAALARMKARRISAPRALFAGADLHDADLMEGELTDADFTGAQLSHCTFIKVHAAGLRLNGATGNHVKFGLATLTASRADADTVLTDTRLFAADLSDACWEGARLHRAQLIEANMERADFSRCDLTGAIMILSMAREAKFMKADLTNANLTGINLFKGSLRKAVLSRTDLKLSNLYGVDFYQAKMLRANLERANIEKTLLKLGRKS